MRASEVREAALSAINRFFVAQFGALYGGQSGVGIVGGTVNSNGKRTVIRTSDRTLVTRGGDCHRFRDPSLPPSLITEHDIGFKCGLEEIMHLLKDACYLSGLCVANPVVRWLMFNVPLERIHELTLKEALSKPRWPVVNSIAPGRGSGPKMRQIPLEDFRVRDVRPNWCLKLARTDLPFFVPSKGGGEQGFYQRLSPAEMKKHLSYWFSAASGVEWTTDYAILARVPNPVNPARAIVVCGGSHWLGTFGANACISHTTEVPEKKLVFRNVAEAMAWIGEVTRREGIQYFQAILRVTDSFLIGGRREIEVYCQGVFDLGRIYAP